MAQFNLIIPHPDGRLLFHSRRWFNLLSTCCCRLLLAVAECRVARSVRRIGDRRRFAAGRHANLIANQLPFRLSPRRSSSACSKFAQASVYKGSREGGETESAAANCSGLFSVSVRPSVCAWRRSVHRASPKQVGVSFIFLYTREIPSIFLMNERFGPPPAGLYGMGSLIKQGRKKNARREQNVRAVDFTAGQDCVCHGRLSCLSHEAARE